MLDPSLRPAVVSEARDIVSSVPSAVPPGRRCHEYALALAAALLRRGVRAMLQAGTSRWMMVPPELDDGASPTHHSWEYTPGSAAVRVGTAAVLLPELHCWVAVPGPPAEVIDITTCFRASMAEEVLGAGCWKAPPPPDYLWWAEGEPHPRGVEYLASREATELVHAAFGLSVTFLGRRVIIGADPF